MNRCSARPTSPRGSRTILAAGPVSASPISICAEVRALDAGSWFVDDSGGPRTARAFGTLDRLDRSQVAHYRSGRVTIPTLADALVLTKEHDWLVNVEIKSFPDCPPGLVERVLEVVADTGTASHVLISSFDHADLAVANRPDREHALGILTSTPLYRIHDYAADLVGADTVHVSAEVLGSESIAYRRDPAARSLRGDCDSGTEEAPNPDPRLIRSTTTDTIASRNTWPRSVSTVFSPTTPQGAKRYFAGKSSASLRRPR